MKKLFVTFLVFIVGGCSVRLAGPPEYSDHISDVETLCSEWRSVMFQDNVIVVFDGYVVNAGHHGDIISITGCTGNIVRINDDSSFGSQRDEYIQMRTEARENYDKIIFARFEGYFVENWQGQTMFVSSIDNVSIVNTPDDLYNRWYAGYE